MTIVPLFTCLLAVALVCQDPPKPVPAPERQEQPAEKPPRLELGKALPAPFALPDIDGIVVRSEQLAGQILVVDFWSTTCPISRGWESRLAAIHGEYATRGVTFLMVNSNEGSGEIGDAEPLKEGDKPYQKIRSYLKERELRYRVLVDHRSVVADLFQAKTTPDVFVFDKDGVLVYRGLIDDDASGQKGEKATQYLRPVLDKLLAGEAVEPTATKPIGCAIKRPSTQRDRPRR